MIQLRECGNVDSDVLLKSENNPLPPTSSSSSTSTTQQSRTFRDKIIAVSTNGDRLLIADKSILKIFSPSDKQDPIRIDHGDPITQLLVIPLPTTGKNSKNQPPRFCVAAGHISGTLRFFSDKGHLILSQVFHKTQIHRLKLNMTTPQEGSERREGLWILYSGAVVAIEGLPLFSALRGSLAQSDAGKFTEISLDFKKWDVNVNEPKDFLPFHLVSSPVSILNVRQTNSQIFTHQFITAGKEPNFAYFAPSESDSTTLIAVASTMATKLTTAFSSWFGRQEDTVFDRKHPELIKGIPIYPKFRLEDKRREVQSLEVDPTGILGIAIDGFGRMLLLDLHDLLVIRMWKGYRNVQTSWLVDFVQDEGEQRLRVILVVYLERSGQVECWQMRHGKKLATTNVGSGARLISTSGLNGSPISEPISPKTPSSNLPRSFLLLSSGQLLEISLTSSN